MQLKRVKAYRKEADKRKQEKIKIDLIWNQVMTLVVKRKW